MPRNSVTVYGVEMTRETLEKALKEINKPDDRIPNLTRVRARQSLWGAGTPRLIEGVAIRGVVQDYYRKGRDCFDGGFLGDVTVVMEDGQGDTYGSDDALLKTWDVI